MKTPPPDVAAMTRRVLERLMPHYRDGSQAKVGDVARGMCHGNGRVTEGLIISITPGAESCNCLLAYPILHKAGASDKGSASVAILTTGWCTLSELEKVDDA